MRVVIVVEAFTRNVGYSETNLPKALVRLGAEGHVVASNPQAHRDDPKYKEAFVPWNGPAIQPCEAESIDCFTLHRLSHQTALRNVWITNH